MLQSLQKPPPPGTDRQTASSRHCAKVCKCRQGGEGSEEEGRRDGVEDEDEEEAMGGRRKSKRRMKPRPDGGLKKEERSGTRTPPRLSKCVLI